MRKRRKRIRDASAIFAGRTFGALTVVARLPNTRGANGSARAWWSCSCVCGVVRPVRDESLRTGQALSCGCSRHQRRIDNLTGRRFGTLSVEAVADVEGKESVWYSVRCDCGRTRVMASHLIRRAQTCGRFHERLDQQTRHPLYPVWSNMKQRCLNATNDHYVDYGGRGISVCERWMRSFRSFVDDVGDRPPGKGRSGRAAWSLDRIDPNGNYEPGNVRWSTQVEQCANKRLSRERVGELLTIAATMTDPVAWLRAELMGDT
jgi:hypothetical protein